MWLKIVLFILFMFMDSVQNQICTKRNMVTRWVPQMYTYTYIETYMGRCFLRRQCRKSTIKTAVDMKQVPKAEVQIIQVCCDGYIRADNNSGSDGRSIICTPVCMPPCKNGICTSPGRCKCNEGYLLDPRNTRNCLPFCPSDCGHGICVAPSTCKCNFGYSLQNGTCAPICTEPCVNGKCIAPDSCECLPGYRKSESNTCDPYCSKGCVHGTCVGPEICNCNSGYIGLDICVPSCKKACGNGTCIAPDTCECNSGYILQNGTCEPYCTGSCFNGECVAPDICECNYGYSLQNGTCQPVCNETCTNGRCIAPDTCECLSGYNKSENSSCVPHCSKGCIDGVCISPEICVCNSGYTMDFEDKCIPSCSLPCGNGTCIATNVCQCFPGYKINEAMEFDKSLCMPKCHNCEGVCVAPDKCVCNSPYQTVHLNVDGGSCDCFGDCSDPSTKCERTICRSNYTEIKSLDGDELEANETSDGYNVTNFYTSTEYEGTETVDDSGDYKDELHFNLTDGYKNDTMHKEDVVSFPYWLYAVIAILVVLMIILLIVIIKRKSLSKHFNGGSYVVEDDKAKEASSPSQTRSMRLSTLVAERDKDDPELCT